MIFISFKRAYANSNLGPKLISHRFRDTATYSFKLSIKNCGQTAADGDMVTTDIPWEVANALSDGTIADPQRFTVLPQYRTIGIP